MPNGSRTDPERTPRGLRTDPEQTRVHTKGGENYSAPPLGLAYQLWHKLWLHFFWPTFWLHCILYFTYSGRFAPCIGTVQNIMLPESWPKQMEP